MQDSNTLDNLAVAAKSSERKHQFLLVHGAFYGGWVWHDVVRGLREKGHDATAFTLTGLGERRHIHSEIGLDTHIEDVVSHIEMEDLHDIVLVGWSMGGMVTAGVHSRVAHRISSMIFLDSFVPENGRSLYDYDITAVRDILDDCKKYDRPVGPFPVDVFGEYSQEIKQYVEQRHAPQPWRTGMEPVQITSDLTAQRTSYIRCTQHAYPPFDEAMARMERSGRVEIVRYDAAHLCMMTAPEKTAELLIQQA